ncbi:MAG: two-component regulator propeller domain-containing protein, partial [Chitinophagaceae bacterium]
MRISGLLLLTLFFFMESRANFFRNYQIEDGLSHNSVWSVMQDRKGFMWFGTADGLNRFDGKSFKVFRKKQGDSTSIGSNFIHHVKEDGQGRLLIGTKQGLYLFDADSERFRRIVLDEDNTSISYIHEDPDGNIWLACYGHGLYQLDRNLKVKKHYQQKGQGQDIPVNFIWTMVQDYNGIIWLGSDGAGLVRFDPAA